MVCPSSMSGWRKFKVLRGRHHRVHLAQTERPQAQPCAPRAEVVTDQEVHPPIVSATRRPAAGCGVPSVVYTWLGADSVGYSERARHGTCEVFPRYIQEKLLIWIDAVELRGLAEVRKVPGFHDEPLKGDRKRQRSIRLNQAYRANLRGRVSGAAQFVRVEEVNKHRY